MTADQFEPRIGPAAPPTQAAPLAVGPSTSSWPTVLGVVAIILGALAALSGLWGVVGARFVNEMVAGMPGADRAMLDVSAQWQAWTIPLSLGALVLGALLLVGGSGLAIRRRLARAVVLAWAGVKMLFVVAQTAIAYMIQHATFDVMMRQTGSGVTMTPAVSTGMTGAMAVMGLLWGWAGPVFALIWFFRAKIRDEVAEWR